MIPTQRVLNLAASGDPERIVALTIQKKGTAGIDRLISHPLAKVRVVLAGNPHLQSRHIDKLIYDTIRRMRISGLGEAGTVAEVAVLYNLTKNPNLQPHHKEQLAKVIHVDELEGIIFVDGVETVFLIPPTEAEDPPERPEE